MPRKIDPITHETRFELTQTEGVTLNGVPARITGARNDFATVTRNDGLSAEWAWPTVARIVNRNKAFSTI